MRNKLFYKYVVEDEGYSIFDSYFDSDRPDIGQYKSLRKCKLEAERWVWGTNQGFKIKYYKVYQEQVR